MRGLDVLAHDLLGLLGRHRRGHLLTRGLLLDAAGLSRRRNSNRGRHHTATLTVLQLHHHLLRLRLDVRAVGLLHVIHRLQILDWRRAGRVHHGRHGHLHRLHITDGRGHLALPGRVRVHLLRRLVRHHVNMTLRRRG